MHSTRKTLSCEVELFHEKNIKIKNIIMCQIVSAEKVKKVLSIWYGITNVT